MDTCQFWPQIVRKLKGSASSSGEEKRAFLQSSNRQILYTHTHRLVQGRSTCASSWAASHRFEFGAGQTKLTFYKIGAKHAHHRSPRNISIRSNIYNNDPIRYIVSVVSCFVLPIPIYIVILPSRNTLVTRVLRGGPFSTDRANVGSQHTPRSRWTAWTFTVVLHASGSSRKCTRVYQALLAARSSNSTKAEYLPDS